MSTLPEDFTVERCTQQEAHEIFYGWAFSEHWNPSTKGEDVRDVYFKADPQGFFKGQLKGEVVAIVSALRYGDEQAWIGFYIASPKHRGKGFGLATFNKALEHVGHDRASVGLDGLLVQVENYKKSGFTSIAWMNERRNGAIDDLVDNQERVLAERISKNEVTGLVDLSDPLVDLNQLPAIEQRFSGLKRPEFVKDWANFHINHHKERRFGAAVLSTDGTKDEKSGKPVVLGYACVRPAVSSYRIGPLYATSPEVAKQLLVKLANNVVQAERQESYNIPLKFDVDVPNTNPGAVKLFDGLGWKDTFPSMRMWKGTVPEHDVSGVYAVSTLEVA
ncbi:MAG: acyl-CoA N-acyltransferase [Benniella sp.]|nr:MAG: acyl-CoA N-acyltransferase [Benniella sp.]